MTRGNQKFFNVMLVLIFSMVFIPLLTITGAFVLVPKNNAWIFYAVAGVISLFILAMGSYMYKIIYNFLVNVDKIIINKRELLEHTQCQAQTLEEISATIEQVNGSIRQTSYNAELANQCSKSTLEVVGNGEKLADETLNAMNQISASSKQIKVIVGVVHEIASQTNLLAINAAVEAARAGEQGKGFAIVAAEIKNLARKVTESAKEIEALILDDISRVDRGNFIVQQSAELLKRIIANTDRTSQAIAEVALAMSEQAAAAQEIEAAVNQLSQYTHESAMLFDSKSKNDLSPIDYKPVNIIQQSLHQS